MLGTLSKAGTSSRDGIAPSSSLSLLSLPEPGSEQLLFRLLPVSGELELLEVGVAEAEVVGVGTSAGEADAVGLPNSKPGSVSGGRVLLSLFGGALDKGSSAFASFLVV